MAEAAASPIIIKEGSGGVSPVTAIIGLAALVAAGIAGKKWWDQREKNQGESELDTPEGVIALQLKTVFEKFPVSDTDYRKIAALVTPANQQKVYDIYRKISLRNLSDDIASHIGAGTQTQAAKEQKINSTSGSIINIDANENIQFLVSKGSIVRFEPGSKTAIPLFLEPLSVAVNPDKPYYSLQPTAKQFLVSDVKLVPLEGHKPADGWQKYFRDVKTRKVFAAVQITIPIQTVKGKQILGMWADARFFRMGKGTNYLKGLGQIGDVSLIA